MNKAAIIRRLAQASPAEQTYLEHILRAAILGAAQSPPVAIRDGDKQIDAERQWFFIPGFDGP